MVQVPQCHNHKKKKKIEESFQSPATEFTLNYNLDFYLMPDAFLKLVLANGLCGWQMGVTQRSWQLLWQRCQP